MVLPERVEDVVGQPGWVAELEGGAGAGGQQVEERSEAVHVFFELGRELEEDGPQPVSDASLGFAGGNSVDRLNDINPDDIERVEILR